MNIFLNLKINLIIYERCELKVKVILKDNIKGVGKKDEVINASDGYARNFLFPKNLAVEANAENMSKLKAKQNSTAFKKGQEKEEAEKISDKMQKIMLTMHVRAGENGKIFGGVSSKEIAEELQKTYKINVDKKKIDLKETIKACDFTLTRQEWYDLYLASEKPLP